MNRQSVESSNIKAIGYDPVTRILEVEFGKDVEDGHPYNRLYQYFEIPAETYQALMSAPSHGEFLYWYIAYKFTYKYLGKLGDLE